MMTSSNTSNIKSDINNGKAHLQNLGNDISKEFKTFVADIENLVRESASLTGEDLNRAKAKINQRIEAAKQCANETGSTIMQQARKTADLTNHYVHEQPWTVVGTGALVSFMLGFLLARRA